jgi:hypothetical protein
MARAVPAAFALVLAMSGISAVSATSQMSECNMTQGVSDTRTLSDQQQAFALE